jgi:hypothetical protein
MLVQALTFCAVFNCCDCLPCQVRSMVSDFAVFLTIFTMVVLDFLIGVPSPKLQVPNVFKVSGPR